MGPPVIHSTEATVVSNRRIAPRGWVLHLEVEGDLAMRAGQFAHLRIGPGEIRPFLRRPFSIWDVSSYGGRTRIGILYVVRGAGTRRMSVKRPGEKIGFLGPLGNTLEVPKGTRRVIMIAGGAGIVPFHLFARQLHRELGSSVQVVLLFGARTREELYGLEDLRRLPLGVETCTEDGTEGMRGRVTDLLRDYLARTGREGVQAYACGPWGMLEAVSRLSSGLGVPCTLSLETRMGCGLGACRACVVPVRSGDGGWRYSRVCCEGPNYPSRDIAFAQGR